MTTGSGNDTLFGGGGSDLLSSGDGDDYLNSGADDDRMYGAARNTYVENGTASASLSNHALTNHVRLRQRRVDGRRAGNRGRFVVVGDGDRDVLQADQQPL